MSQDVQKEKQTKSNDSTEEPTMKEHQAQVQQEGGEENTPQAKKVSAE